MRSDITVSSKKIDMLEGPVFKNIIAYTIPIIITNLLQLLFNAADLIVVGRFSGSLSVAAVGATGSLVTLLTNFFIGLSVGTGVTTATSIGAGDKKAVSEVVHTAIPTAIISGLILTTVGLFFSESILKLMDTPENVLPLSAQYLKIYFAGITATMIYNFASAILRAAGDTRSPLIFLSISGVLNVVLNLIFVIVFHMNVAGVALATVISQVLSATLVIIALVRRTDACKLCLSKLRIHKAPILSIMRLGIPAGIQSSLFSISNVLIQSSVNSFGEVVVSGCAAASNIEGFVYVSMNAFHHTALNFVGQNMGVKNFRRISKIYRTCLLMVTVVGLTLGVTTRIFGNSLLSIYITDSPEAILYGIIRMNYIGLPYFLCGLMDTTTGAMRGMGVSLIPTVIMVLGVCVFRIVWIYTIFQMPQFHTITCIYLSYPVSWILTFIAECIALMLVIKRKHRDALMLGYSS